MNVRTNYESTATENVLGVSLPALSITRTKQLSWCMQLTLTVCS